MQEKFPLVDAWIAARERHYEGLAPRLPPPPPEAVMVEQRGQADVAALGFQHQQAQAPQQQQQQRQARLALLYHHHQLPSSGAVAGSGGAGAGTGAGTLSFAAVWDRRGGERGEEEEGAGEEAPGGYDDVATDDGADMDVDLEVEMGVGADPGGSEEGIDHGHVGQGEDGDEDAGQEDEECDEGFNRADREEITTHLDRLLSLLDTLTATQVRHRAQLADLSAEIDMLRTLNADGEMEDVSGDGGGNRQ